MRLEIDHGATVWLHRYARRQFWRVSSWYDLDDLIQDGYMHYYRIAERYSDVKERPHIMSLFKRCFVNHCHDLAKNKTRQPDANLGSFLTPTQDESHVMDTLAGSEPEAATLQTLLSQAPEPVKAVLASFNDPEKLKQLRSSYRVRLDGTRETINERLCRLAGVDPNSMDLVLVIKQHFGTQTA
mgnify:CR=1 FL=1